MRSEGKPSNSIPYRNSPITKILKYENFLINILLKKIIIFKLDHH